MRKTALFCKTPGSGKTFAGKGRLLSSSEEEGMFAIYWVQLVLDVSDS